MSNETSSPAQRPMVDQYPSSREDSPQNDWSLMSMLDVTHYWNRGDTHDQSDATCTTLSSGHLPSYVRTQTIASGSLSHPVESLGVSDEIPDLNNFAPTFYTSYSLNTALSAIRRSQMPPIDYHASIAPAPFEDVEDHAVASTFSSHSSPLHIDDAQIPPSDDNMNDQMNAALESGFSENVFNYNVATTTVNFRTAHPPQGPPEPIDSRCHGPAHGSALDETTASPNDPPPLQNTNAVVHPSPVPRSHSPPSSSLRYSPYYRPASGKPPRASVSKRRTDLQNPLRLNADLSVTNEYVTSVPLDQYI
jgi:hypothetical protein